MTTNQIKKEVLEELMNKFEERPVGYLVEDCFKSYVGKALTKAINQAKEEERERMLEILKDYGGFEGHVIQRIKQELINSLKE